MVGTFSVQAKSGDAKSDEEGDAEEVDQLEDTSVATLAPIDIGDVLPSVTLKNEKGEDVDVAGLAAEKGLVVFLIPKADTRTCCWQSQVFPPS